jgi:hypothetical protein
MLSLWILLVDRLLKGPCRGVADWLPYKLSANEGCWAYTAVELSYNTAGEVDLDVGVTRVRAAIRRPQASR